MMKAFPVYSIQETFDKVVAGLRKQGRPARNANGNCQYRLEDKNASGFVKFLKCAAGLLIKRSQYSEDLENQVLCNYKELDEYRGDSDYKKRIVLASIIHRNGYNLDFVRRLQRAHDAAYSTSDFELQFQLVAKEFRLNYTPPKIKAKRVRKPKAL